MSLPTKVLNTHRKSLNLVDIPLSLETKVNSEIFFYVVCVFRTQCFESLWFPAKPYASSHFVTLTAKPSAWGSG